MELQELVDYARRLLRGQRKLRLGPTAKAAIEELFQVAISVELPSMEGLEGAAFREELSSRIKRTIDTSSSIVGVRRGYELAWRAIDVMHRNMTWDDSASRTQKEAAIRIHGGLRGLDGQQLHTETVEAYIHCLVSIQPFDLVNRHGETLNYNVVAYYQLMRGMDFASRPLDERASISETLNLLAKLTLDLAPWLDGQFRL